MKTNKRAKYILNQHSVPKTIKKHTKENKNIIYGARSINKQIGMLRILRPTIDYDIYSKQPHKSAIELEKKIDKKLGGNYHYHKMALHKGTHKIMFIGNDMIKGTRDDVGVVDFSKTPRKIKTKTINGIKYSKLSHERKNKLKALSSKKYEFRHKKDRKDLNLMKLKNKIYGRN